MAELNRLLHVFVRSCHVRRATDHHGQQDESSRQRQEAEKTDLGKGIRAATEDLRHRLAERSEEAKSLTEMRLRGRERGKPARPVPTCTTVVKKGSSSVRPPELVQPRDLMRKPCDRST